MYEADRFLGKSQMEKWENISDKEKNTISWALFKALNRLKDKDVVAVYSNWACKRAQKEHVDLIKKLGCQVIIKKHVGRKGFCVKAKSGISMWIDIEHLSKREQNKSINDFVKAWCCNE